MESMLQRARAAAAAAAEKTELLRAAMERSKGTAMDHIRGLTLNAAAAVQARPTISDKDQNELKAYGITPELQDFVQGLTIDTFRAFPLSDDEMSKLGDVDGNVSDLTPWQETHARLVLTAVPGMSELRYQLCPKFIKEKRFWRIYFTLMETRISKYIPVEDTLPVSETPGAPFPAWSQPPSVKNREKSVTPPVVEDFETLVQELEMSVLPMKKVPQIPVDASESSSHVLETPSTTVQEGPKTPETPALHESQRKKDPVRTSDADLDAYLLGSSDDDDDDDEPGTNHGSHDTKFDQLFSDEEP